MTPLIYNIKFDTQTEKEAHQNMLDNLKHVTGKNKTDLVKEAVEMMYNNIIKGVTY